MFRIRTSTQSRVSMLQSTRRAFTADTAFEGCRPRCDAVCACWRGLSSIALCLSHSVLALGLCPTHTPVDRLPGILWHALTPLRRPVCVPTLMLHREM